MTTRTCLLLCALALSACNNMPAPTDAPVAPSDAPVGPPSCPTAMVPSPEEQMGPCCYRVSQADHLDAPEMRLRYIDITSPADPSPLGGTAVGGILNNALQQETFNWLFRMTGADADGPIEIVTGFGRRNAAGTYSFSTGAAPDDPTWAPVTVPATLTGESVVSEVIPGPLTVPIFDEAGTTVQIELILHSLTIESTTLSEDRSCIGALAARGAFTTAATLSGYIRVDEAQAGVINVSGIMASLCGVIAGSITDAEYCNTMPQSAWTVMPDSMCDDATGICHRDGEGGVDCDPATTCNAWYLESDFAAVGVDIDP